MDAHEKAGLWSRRLQLDERSFGRALLRFGWRQEFDPDFVSGYSDEPASPIGKTSRRQQEKEFPQVQPLNGIFNLQPGAGLRHVPHHAISAPCPVDSHDENINTALEIDALVFSQSEGHLAYPRFSINATWRPSVRATLEHSANDTNDALDEIRSGCRLPSKRARGCDRHSPADFSYASSPNAYDAKSAKPIQNRRHAALATLMSSPQYSAHKI
jgi:hypothetical protein